MRRLVIIFIFSVSLLLSSCCTQDRNPTSGSNWTNNSKANDKSVTYNAIFKILDQHAQPLPEASVIMIEGDGKVINVATSDKTG